MEESRSKQSMDRYNAKLPGRRFKVDFSRAERKSMRMTKDITVNHGDKGTIKRVENDGSYYGELDKFPGVELGFSFLFVQLIKDWE